MQSRPRSITFCLLFALSFPYTKKSFGIESRMEETTILCLESQKTYLPPEIIREIIKRMRRNRGKVRSWHFQEAASQGYNKDYTKGRMAVRVDNGGFLTLGMIVTNSPRLSSTNPFSLLQ